MRQKNHKSYFAINETRFTDKEVQLACHKND